MLNFIWLGLILAAVLIGGFEGRVKEVGDAAVKSAETAVTLALGLIGVMTVWLGMMRLADKSGLVQVLARWLRPILRWLFPDVPPEHPAMGSMVMNIAANMLGLSNAATPLGLRAMRDLASLNKMPGTATNAMCTFLAINTSSVQLIPITAVAILAAAGSRNPSIIIGTALLATICSTAAGIFAVKLLERFSAIPAGNGSGNPSSDPEQTAALPDAPAVRPLDLKGKILLAGLFACFIGFFFQQVQGKGAPAPGEASVPVRAVNTLSVLAIPFLVSFFPLYGALRGLKVYEEFVEGAKEGFHVAIRIIPYLVAMLVAIGMFRAGGGIDWITWLLKPLLDLVAFPTELLPMALLRPLSGSGSLALFSDIVKQFGADTLLARTAGTLYGSTETTFYVIAVYFGSISVTRTRHAIPAGLIADATGMFASVYLCRWLLE